MPNSLASARSIFEQNIQKNKEAGCEKNILGQKHTSCSRHVTRRLFAHNKLSDESSSHESLNIISSGHQRRGSQHSTGSSSTVAAIRRKNSQRSLVCQPKGQTNTEAQRQQRTELKPPSLHEKETNYPALSSHGSQGRNEKIPNNYPFKDAAFAKQQQQERKQNSISSLADHLGKLDITSLRQRGGGDGDSLNSSQSSLEVHRDRVKLPDFRQSSSFARANQAMSSGQQPAKNRLSNNRAIITTTLTTTQRHEPFQDDSVSSLGSLDASNLSLSPTRLERNNSMEDNSTSSNGHIRLKRSSRRSNTERLSSLISSPPKTTSRHGHRSFSNSTRNNNPPSSVPLNNNTPRRTSSSTSWIRPSVVLEDDDTCTSSHHSQPFKSVPFTKSVIKRHSSKQATKRESSSASTKRESIRNKSYNQHDSAGSNGSLNHSSSRSSARRRSSMGNSSSKSQQRRPTNNKPAQPDPEEVALQEEIQALQRQIQVSQSKLSQVQEGEQYDLKRVEDTKERKLKRINASEKSHSSGQEPLEFTPQEAQALEEEYQQAKHAIRQLKQDNAKVHNQNRKRRVQSATIRTSNRLLGESNAELQEMLTDLKSQQQSNLDEMDHWMRLAASYQKSILDLEEGMEKKNHNVQLERVKAARMQLEDKIDILVAFMQNKCSDYDLVEELTILGGFDESGWEDDEDDTEDYVEDEYDSEDEARASFMMRLPYKNKQGVDSDEASPTSVADLVATSTHSLHLFVE